jgi:hypothetical protein
MHRLRPTPKVPPNSALTLCGITHRSLSHSQRKSLSRIRQAHATLLHPPITRKVFRTPRTPAAPPNIVHPLNRHSPASDPPPSSALHPEVRCRPPHPSIYPIENANEKPPIPPALKPPLRPPHPGVPIYIPQPLRFPLPQPGMCKKVTKISNITLDTNSLISYIMFISWGG